MKVSLYRFLDSFQHSWNLYWKTFKAKRKWGDRWEDYTRPGRRYTRVIAIPPSRPDQTLEYRLREKPGWEMACWNCKCHSLITEDDMPQLLNWWQKRHDDCEKRGVNMANVPPIPTMATAGCPECRSLPGAPE